MFVSVCKRRFAPLVACSMALLLALVGPLSVLRADEVSSEREDDGLLRVVSYNVQFLPGPGALANKRKNPTYRAKTIGREMARFDVVGLNEVFEARPRGLILDALREAWGEELYEVTIPRAEDRPFNGGLMIVSRLPIVEWNHVIYSKYSTPQEYGLAADGYAAKGALHARIARAKDCDETFDVFVTHLEARSDEARLTQYEELSQFIARHSSPERPTLLLGDMNTKGQPDQQADPDSPYHVMLAAYGKCRPESKLIDVWPTLRGDEHGGTTEQESSEIGKRIDYIFTYQPPPGYPRLVPVDIRVNGFLDPQTVALSDHSAVEGDFRWQDATSK